MGKAIREKFYHIQPPEGHTRFQPFSINLLNNLKSVSGNCERNPPSKQKLAELISVMTVIRVLVKDVWLKATLFSTREIQKLWIFTSNRWSDWTRTVWQLENSETPSRDPNHSNIANFLNGWHFAQKVLFAIGWSLLYSSGLGLMISRWKFWDVCWSYLLSFFFREN